MANWALLFRGEDGEKLTVAFAAACDNSLGRYETSRSKALTRHHARPACRAAKTHVLAPRAALPDAGGACER